MLETNVHTERHINVKNLEGIRLKRLRSRVSYGAKYERKSQYANLLAYRQSAFPVVMMYGKAPEVIKR